MTGQKSLFELATFGTARDAALDALCRHCEHVIDGSCCAILVFDSSDAQVRVRQAIGSGMPPGFLAAVEGLTLELAADVCAASAGGRGAVIPSNQIPTELVAIARDFALHVSSAFPLCPLEERQPAGLLVLCQACASLPTEEDHTRLGEAAELAKLALSHTVTDRATPDTRQNAFRQMVENLPAITYVLEIGEAATATYVSPRVVDILGWQPAEYGAHAAYWFTHVHPDDRDRIRAEVAAALATGEPLTMEYQVSTRSGEVVWLRDMARLAEVRADGCQVWHGVQFDITAEKTAETQLQRLAFYDSLTGLPNRRLCIDRIESVLNAPGHPEVALLFIDLDRFKFINDGIGHAAGDELLVAVARRLSDHVAGRGSLARFGGDEFVAVLVDTALGDVEAMAGTLLSALRHPFRVDGYELDVEGTIGIAVASPGLRTPEALLRAADVALYRAKADGRGGYAVYDPHVDEQSPDRFEREADLRRALASNEFEIAYQPVVDIETRQILAVEALLRWNHPKRGFLESSEFIEFVDETGLIIPLGKWVIEEACRQMRHWQDLYPAVRSLQVSVNLSGRQFRQSSLATDVALVLRQTGLAPECLALEIKEGDALADSTAIAATLKAFRRLGVRVTIDDFGKGWSALGSLTRFTIDDLKIDGSCVSRLGRDQQDIDVVRALVGMAKAMGLDVTAGAVETGEQLAMLRELGCDRAQGRHLAPPLMADELERLFQRAGEFGLRPGD